ncbi:glycosyltransferase family 39 protein [Candidatus Woesearchaeota archaeon]|nr:glycosyltransferase family 39 protein [Candidatus Woesearchaeota archaeon]
MKRSTELILLFALFAIVCVGRLLLAFSTPSFSSDDSYFLLRDLTYLHQHLLPSFYDPLSYGGRSYLFSPVFSYLLLPFSFLMSPELVGKIVPQIFAASLLFPVYALVMVLTKNHPAAFLSALLAELHPLYLKLTLNTLSPYALLVPLTFWYIYFFVTLQKDNWQLYLFLVLIFILTRLHFSAILLLIAFFFYLLLTKLENIEVRREEIEVMVFTSLIMLWFQFLIYKKAFLVHSYRIIWQNIPSQILSRYFVGFHALNVILQIGIFPFLFGVYAVYRYLLRSKSKNVYLLSSLAFAVLFLLITKMIELDIGLLYLGMVLIIMLGISWKHVLLFLDKSIFVRHKVWISILLASLILLASIPPMITAATQTLQRAPSAENLAAYQWAAVHLPENVTLLTLPEEGNYVTYFAQRKNVMDTQFLFIDNIDQRYEDVITMYTTAHKIRAITLLEKYHVDYILYSPTAKQRFLREQPRYIDDPGCFELVYNQTTKIWKSKCRIDLVSSSG